MRMAGSAGTLREQAVDEQGSAAGACHLGHAYLAQRIANARSCFASGLQRSYNLDDRPGMAGALEGMAAALTGRPEMHEAAARMLGAAGALRATTGTRPSPRYTPAYTEACETLEAALGAARYATAIEAGRRLFPEEFVQLAMRGAYG
jgi:hypothetical protein